MMSDAIDRIAAYNDPANGTIVQRVEMALNDCEGCRDHPESIPGVRFPTAANEDGCRRWIERCDECERYEGDEAAAEALVRAGKITGFSLERPFGSSSLTPHEVA
jgi:hypothetical protein